VNYQQKPCDQARHARSSGKIMKTRVHSACEGVIGASNGQPQSEIFSKLTENAALNLVLLVKHA
jgi:hypothetical protein